MMEFGNIAVCLCPCSHTSTATSHWGISSWSSRTDKHIWHMNNFGYKCLAHTRSKVYFYRISKVYI